MRYPTSDIEVEFEINRPFSYSATELQQSYFHEGQTDGRTDVADDNNRFFFEKKRRRLLKNDTFI